MRRTGVALRRTGVALRRTGVALRRTGVSLRRPGVALRRPGVALRRTRAKTSPQKSFKHGCIHKFITTVFLMIYTMQSSNIS